MRIRRRFSTEPAMCWECEEAGCEGDGECQREDAYECDEDAVAVEVMPRHLRESHRAAGNSGVYPHSGARRYIVDRSCVVEDEWTYIIRDATPSDDYPLDMDGSKTATI